MKFLIITPARPSAKSGNRTTAERWAKILRNLNHTVRVKNYYENDICDALIALHAWRSADAIRKFRVKYPQLPLIVALTGTDLYKYLFSHRKTTLRSIEYANHLVVLHELAGLELPKKFRSKVHVIYQSAKTLRHSSKPNKNTFYVGVIGHLRVEKDSLRAAYAARYLPKNSRVRIHHFGKAHDEQWKIRAHREMKRNARYHWHGEVPHSIVEKFYRDADLMVLSSRMEGGANVISEACCAGLPVIASNISGSIGLLGKNYPGYFKPGNTKSLVGLLRRAETDPTFLKNLTTLCERTARRFTVQRETDAWKKLIKKLWLPKSAAK